MSWVNICDIVWPIGAIYSSSESTPPSELFGGTWEQLKNNRFLRGSTAWSTGGSAYISESQLPSLYGAWAPGSVPGGHAAYASGIVRGSGDFTSKTGATNISSGCAAYGYSIEFGGG